MKVTFRDYRFSYSFLVITILFFSFSFSAYNHPFFTTIIFLAIVNTTCFLSEYFAIKYKKKNKGNHVSTYSVFAYAQIIFTVLLFIAFTYYIK